jgi:DNA-directed RNA polymerase subunit RPC12/RpoP
VTLYSYTCGQCKRLFNTEDRSDGTICPYCKGQAVRKFTFYTASGMKEHWNNAVGQYVSNRQEMSDALKRQSEEASVRTGIDHQYEMVEPADMRDPTAHGVSEDGLEATRKILHDRAT